MSVKVDKLTKLYGSQHAVNEISFEAKPGEILGFLGPNGAGKTTTMKIITCFIPQTRGRVEVCGFDVAKDPMEVRRRVGYLPEHNPLYKDMYVKEYLNFIARLHKVAKPSRAVAEMVERTGLGREQHKQIGALSKGYRQRVGLAQAMLHDPDILILDEPTSGLDPNQLVDIRNLVKELGAKKTVIFSTHIMQEVQALCDRVLIINQGNLVANDSIEALQTRVQGNSLVRVEFLRAPSLGELQRIAGVEMVEQLNPNVFELHSKGQGDLRPVIFEFAAREGYVLLEMQRVVRSMEDIFQHLTKQTV